ncbi:hypothetical protein CC2G_014583 [Coprinopsis cinerea AmutBmut pab1-1]|nr:hypothetical protein CC2G_014583 [Coprinopsis cinerea AmutBmut pab1-1]
MPQPFIQSWGKLESELYGAVTRLKSKSSAPMVLPFLPWAHGYRLVFKNPRSYDRAVASSRNWFSVWWGALSFLIAYSETKRDAFSLRGYVPLWHVELEPEVDAAWIDGVFRSVICDFSYKPNRIGCILDIANPKPHQPPLSWFIEHGIPVWYRHYKTLRRPRHLHPVEPEPTPSPPKQASKPEPAWVAHFKRHEEMHARWLEKESAVERQAREARAANPPYSKVRVYEWYPSEKDPDVYERIPVGKKYSRDTLSLYSSTQKIYDPFCNMWDCCDKFGKEDDLDPDEWTIDDLDLPLPFR